MYKLLLALALITTTANKEDGKSSGGLRGLRFASFVNTDKGGPEASACLKAGGDCKSCCGGCNERDIDDGTDFTEELECVCFEGTFDSQVSIKLSNHDDCANVVRQGEAQVTIKGEDGVDAIHMHSPDASYSSSNTSPGYIYGNGGVDYLTCAGNGPRAVRGSDYFGYQADGGNVLSCSGDGNYMFGGADCDDITCEGKYCNGKDGNDLLKVDYDYVDTPDFQGENVWDLTGGNGIDKCVYNGEDAYYEEYVPGYFTCEPWAEFPDPAC